MHINHSSISTYPLHVRLDISSWALFTVTPTAPCSGISSLFRWQATKVQEGGLKIHMNQAKMATSHSMTYICIRALHSFLPLLLHTNTYSHLVLIFYGSVHFWRTPHSIRLPHPIHIFHLLPLATPNTENNWKHLLPQFVNTIQCYLSTECTQNQFLFLKDCTSKH